MVAKKALAALFAYTRGWYACSSFVGCMQPTPVRAMRQGGLVAGWSGVEDFALALAASLAILEKRQVQACLITVRAMRQGGLAKEEEEEKKRGCCSIFAALVASCQIASNKGRFSFCVS